MDIFQLQCFVAIVKYSSFTKAADSLYISQSSISKHISFLENELGITLLDRSKQNIRPTPAGCFFYQSISEQLDRFNEIVESTKRIGSGKRGIITVGVCDELDINRLLPNFLKLFCDEFPDINIVIEVYNFIELNDLILRGILDIAFTASVVWKQTEYLKRIEINRDLSRLYFSSKHAFAGKPNLAVDDFADDDYISLSPKVLGGRLASPSWTGVAPFHFRKVIDVKSMQALKLYVEANMGVTILGASQSFLYSEKVKSIQVDIPELIVGTDAVWKEGNNNPSLQLFLDKLIRYLKIPK